MRVIAASSLEANQGLAQPLLFSRSLQTWCQRTRFSLPMNGLFVFIHMFSLVLLTVESEESPRDEIARPAFQARCKDCVVPLCQMRGGRSCKEEAGEINQKLMETATCGVQR